MSVFAGVLTFGCRKGEDLMHTSSSDHRQGDPNAETATPPAAETDRTSENLEFTAVGNDGRTIWGAQPNTSILSNRNYGLVTADTQAFYGLTSTSSIFMMNRPDQVTTASIFTDMGEVISEADAIAVVQQACSDYYSSMTLAACVSNFVKNSGTVVFQLTNPLPVSGPNDTNNILNMLYGAWGLTPVTYSPSGTQVKGLVANCSGCHFSDNVLRGDDGTVTMAFDVRGTNSYADTARQMDPVTLWKNAKANVGNTAYPLWSKSTWLHDVGALGAQALSYWNTYGNNPNNYNGVLTESALESSMQHATTDSYVGTMWLYAYLTIGTTAQAYNASGDTTITDTSVQTKTSRADLEEFIKPTVTAVTYTATNTTSTMTATAHGFTSGQAVTISTTGTPPGSPALVVGQQYYVHVIDANTFNFTNTYSDAINGTNIIATASMSCMMGYGTCAGTGTQTVMSLQGSVGNGSRYPIALAASQFTPGTAPPIRNQRPLVGFGGTNGRGGDRMFGFTYLNIGTCNSSGCDSAWSSPGQLTNDVERYLLGATAMTVPMPNNFDATLASSWGFASSAAALTAIKSTVGRIILTDGSGSYFQKLANAYYQLRFANPLPAPVQFAPKIPLSKYKVVTAWHNANCQNCHTANIVAIQPDSTAGSNWNNCTYQTETALKGGAAICQFPIVQAQTAYTSPTNIYSASTVFGDGIANAIINTSSPLQGMATINGAALGVNNALYHDAARIPLVRNGALNPWGASSAQNFLDKLPANGGNRTAKKWGVLTGVVGAAGPEIRVLASSPISFDKTGSLTNQKLLCADTDTFSLSGVTYNCQQAIQAAGWTPRALDDTNNLFAKLHSDLNTASNGCSTSAAGTQCITRPLDSVNQGTLSLTGFTNIADFNATMAQLLYGERIGSMLVYDDTDARNSPTPTYFKAVTLVGVAYPTLAVTSPNGTTTIPNDGVNNLITINANTSGNYSECVYNPGVPPIVGCSIYYTVDGSTPTSGSPAGSSVSISTNSTLKAFMWAYGWANGPVTTAAYTFAAVTPTLNPGSSTLTSPTTVSIGLGGSMGGGSFYYTTDGSTPTSTHGTALALSMYSASLTVSNTETLNVIYCNGQSGYACSAVATATYSFGAATPTLSPAPGTYTGAQTVTLSSSGGTVYCTTDGSTPTYPITGTTHACTTVTVSANTILSALAVKSGVANSPVTSGTYTIGAAAPTFSLAAGSYASTQSVSLSSGTSGATIYYTTNGTTPTTASTKYTGTAISVSTSETLEAIAVATGYGTSATSSATYMIGATVAQPTITASTYMGNYCLVTMTGPSGSTIHYSNDGTTTPTATGPNTYSGGMTMMAQGTTIKAVATISGVNSPVLTKTLSTSCN